MNYEKIYNQIIEKARTENRIKGTSVYYEKHHIVPKCLGGSNKKENLVLLTAREHFICHWLLIRVYIDSNKLAHAFFRMCNLKNALRYKLSNYTPSSRMYQEAKDKWIPYLTKQMTGRIMSEDTKQKLRDINLGLKHPRSDEYKAKLSKATKGKKKVMTPARLVHYENMKGRPTGRTAWNKGISPSLETVNKIKNSLSKKINSMKDLEIVKKCMASRKRNKEEKIKNGTYVPRIPWNKGKKFSN